MDAYVMALDISSSVRNKAEYGCLITEALLSWGYFMVFKMTSWISHLISLFRFWKQCTIVCWYNTFPKIQSIPYQIWSTYLVVPHTCLLMCCSSGSRNTKQYSTVILFTRCWLQLLSGRLGAQSACFCIQTLICLSRFNLFNSPCTVNNFFPLLTEQEE